MSDASGTVAQKYEHYLQIMQKAQQLNDQILVKLVLKKLARLDMTRAVSATSGCIIIPFPTVQYPTQSKDYERPTWWTLFKLALAVPGSLVALMLLAYYSYGPGAH